MHRRVAVASDSYHSSPKKLRFAIKDAWAYLIFLGIPEREGIVISKSKIIALG